MNLFAMGVGTGSLIACALLRNARGQSLNHWTIWANVACIAANTLFAFGIVG